MTTPATMTPAPAAPVPLGSAATTPAGGRLPNGELRRQVAWFLAHRAAGEFTPREIARDLGNKSSGAVGNALKSLADRGEAERTSTKPLRYRATTTTAAASTATPAPSGPPRPARTPRRPRTRRATTPPATTTPALSTSPTATATPAPSRSGGKAAVTGPVTRPNGQLYYPRQLAGMSDVETLRRLRAKGMPALLYGPPGTGKTSMAEAAFPDLITIPGDGDTMVADLVGDYTHTADMRYEFVHGPLVTAMREGRPLLIDDATLIPPTVLAVVYPLMDGRSKIVVKANKGEVVEAADGFYVLAGHNPGVHGAILTDALSSRFSAQIHVTTDYQLALQLGVDKRVVKAAMNLDTQWRNGEVGWAPQLRELIAFRDLADVIGPIAAAANLLGHAPEDDRAAVTTALRSQFATTITPLALGAQIKPK